MAKRTASNRVMQAAAVLLAALLVVGCATGRGAEGSLLKRPFGTVEMIEREFVSGDPGGSLVLGFEDEPTSFNPASLGIRPIDVALRNALFAAPIERDPISGNWVGNLAEEWRVDEEGTGLEITLREGLRWSNGEELTVEDVIYSVRHLYLGEDAGANGRGWPNLDAVTIERSGERSYTLAARNAHIDLFALAAAPPLPARILEERIGEADLVAAVDEWSLSGASNLVSSGPFVVSAYESGKEVRLERNPHYHRSDGAGRQLPYLDELLFRQVPEANSIDAMVTGTVDVALLPHREMGTLQERMESGYYIYGSEFQPDSLFLTFNQNPVEERGDPGVFEPRLTWFSDIRFRTAMAHLVDQERIVTETLDGDGERRQGIRPEESPYYLAPTLVSQPDYDPGRAEELLAEMGFREKNEQGILINQEGVPLNFTLLTNDSNSERVAMAAIFAEEAQAIGVDVAVRTVPFQDLARRLMAGTGWDAAIMGFSGAIDPWFPQHFLLSSGMLHMIEPGQEQPRREWEQEIDRLWQVSRETLDEKRQRELQHEIEEIWARELPFIYLPDIPHYIVSRVALGNAIRKIYDPRILPLERLFLTR